MTKEIKEIIDDIDEGLDLLYSEEINLGYKVLMNWKTQEEAEKHAEDLRKRRIDAKVGYNGSYVPMQNIHKEIDENTLTGKIKGKYNKDLFPILIHETPDRLKLH